MSCKVTAQSSPVSTFSRQSCSSTSCGPRRFRTIDARHQKAGPNVPVTRLWIRGLACALLRVALLLPVLGLPVAEAAEAKRVLVIHAFGRDFAPFNAIGAALRTDLALRLGQPVIFHEISLDAEREGPPEDERPLVDYLLTLSRDAPSDLVIANGAPALQFYLRHREGDIQADHERRQDCLPKREWRGGGLRSVKLTGTGA